MGFFDDDSEEAQKYNEWGRAENKAEVSHQLIAGAGAYEAMKSYQEHCERNGKPDSHAEAKRIAAGLAGVMVDRLIETKGMDAVDRYQAKKEAEERCERAAVDKWDDY